MRPELSDERIKKMSEDFDDYLNSDEGKLAWFNTFNPYGITLDIDGHSFDEAMTLLKLTWIGESVQSDTITFDLPPRFKKEKKNETSE